MFKKANDGKWYPYPESLNYENYAESLEVEELFHNNGSSDTNTPNVKCDCSSLEFYIVWWDYPFTGAFCKIICVQCNNELELIDDFA
jgi:hypothetical protein